MKPDRVIAICLIVLCIVSGAVAASAVQERKTKKVTRVKRPSFTERDWDGVYFENLFEEGLVGDRPQRPIPGTTPSTGEAEAAEQNQVLTPADGLEWSSLIQRTTLEDEVKRLQRQLTLDVTTPIKFKTDYAKAHQSYSLLSMLFAIIREYDRDVRWQDFAPTAQVSFEKAAANARVGTSQSYESCRRRLADLTEMVRGGNFPADERTPETLDWSTVVDRSPMMERLQESQDQLKRLTASKGEFARDLATAVHEAELVAAIAAVLTRKGMTDAEDQGYTEFAHSMNESAMKIVEACKNSDFEAASRAVNATRQACDDCHSEWR